MEMADRLQTLDLATRPRAFIRAGQFDHWRILDRDTGAEIAITVDRSLSWPKPRVVGLIVLIEGRTVTSGAHVLPWWARRNARAALVAAKSLARADAASWRARRTFADAVLAGVSA